MNSAHCDYFYFTLLVLVNLASVTIYKYLAGVGESGNPLDCPSDIFHWLAKFCRPLEEVRERL